MSSYLQVHQPWDQIFQKQSFGGAADIIGTELNAASFTLYANGVMVCYRYADGRRRLVSKRLTRQDFLNLYHSISLAMLFNERDSAYVMESLTNTALTEAPTTRMVFYSRKLNIKGLGLYASSPAVDELEAFNLHLEKLALDAHQPFRTTSVKVFVKKVNSGDTSVWPDWPIPELRLDSIYQKDISFYEPNVEENSRLVRGELAEKIQDVVEQTSIYQKFSYGGSIYAVGYRPMLP